ncbi:MAG: STAS domain-containing protein [Pseudomonadota bacterium]
MEMITLTLRKALLIGELNSQSAGLVYDQLVEFCRNSSQDITLNFSAVPSCTRAGCGLVFVVGKLLQQNGARLCVQDARPGVMRMILTSGFGHLLTFEPSVQRRCA